MFDNDLIMPMVDNLINGIYAQVTRINTETLSAEAKRFLKDFKEDLKTRKRIDKEMGNLLVKTIIKYHNDTGEEIQSLLTELSTVSFYAIEPFRKFASHIAEYIMLSSVFAVLTISEDKKEIGDIIEQAVIAVMTNPIYEFNLNERKHIIGILFQTQGYLATLNHFTRTLSKYLPLIKSSLIEGMKTGLDLCNGTNEEFELLKKKHFLWQLLGLLKFITNLGWPIHNLNKNSILKWIKKKTGIELWPVK